MTTDIREQMARAAADHLAASDPIMAELVAAHGLFTPLPHTDYYWELVDSIISQQLSVKAARTIEQRFLALFDGKVPAAPELLSKTVEELRAVGLSRAKASYVLDLAKHVADGELQLERLPDLSNEEATKELVAVKGIGEWTAHMFLIFALGRLDVLPVGDLGIRTGIQKLYNLPALPSPAEVATLAKQRNWHPYESVASWYVWQALDAVPTD
ncbi:MAG TPA: DNA-3-methyladenine glycosylase 2 family protein [Candidatus Saccharimonadales bacterium]|nr:DNA-3-methyladenine glycosylase 2 family protein [Candidatus Saccharimonadales bacterium]